MHVCLITIAQPSTNPRLVKEADALTKAGYNVQVICAHLSPWADPLDRQLLSSRSWQCRYIGGSRQHQQIQYILSRFRHGISRRLVEHVRYSTLLRWWAICRVGPELARAASATLCDLYIGHNLGALPAVVMAAERHNALAGFDAEDFHSGSRHFTAPPSVLDEVTEEIERTFLPRCHYITAASPGIAAAYAAKYHILQPVPILNVFPLAQRPQVPVGSRDDRPLMLYWFSQTIGADRGLEDVVRAMGMLDSRHVELHLRGQWWPGYRQHLLELAESCGVPTTHIVGHDPSPADDMIRLAANYDVGLALEQPDSRNRDICLTNKIFTYLLAGNAVAATNTTGQVALMDQLMGAGFTYRPGDVAALASGLRGWQCDRQALHAARRTAWNWGTSRYNWDFEQNRFLQVIDDVLGGTVILTDVAERKRQQSERRIFDGATL
jgi:hypothetical protein